MKNTGFIILAYSSLVALSFLDNGRGVAYPLILESFNIDGNMGALIFSLASLSGLIVNFTSKVWLPKLGLVIGTRVCLLLLFIASQGIYFAHHIQNYSAVLVSAFIAGVGFGGIGVTMNIMVSEGAPEKKRRRFLSGLHGMYGLASFIAPLLFNFLMGLELSWSHYFATISFVAAIVLIASFWVEDTHKENVKNSYQQTKLPKMMTLAVGLMVGFYVSSEILISSRLTLFLTSGGIGLKEANNVLSLFFLALLSGRFLFAALNLKFKSMTLLFSSLILSFIFFTLGVFYNFYFLALCGLSMSFFFPVSIELINEKFKESSHQMISNSLAIIGVTLMLMHNLFGYLSTDYSIAFAFKFFYLLNSCSFLMLIILAFKTREKA